ncbi:MAG: dihydrolipoyl dehydrogenase [Janthinobacterium lividum]
MQTRSCDVAIIGAGSAGLSAYRAARAHGKNVVLIEKGPYGTTCARVGCMPSKLLIAAAEAAHKVTQAPAFGVHAGALRVDGRAVMARVKSERDRFVSFVLESVEHIAPNDRIEGQARFVAPGELMIGTHTLVQAKTVVIATGSSPSKPDVLKPAGDRLLISDDVFYWDDLPKSIAVVGTGVVGLELGQALHRLSVKVTFYGRDGSLGPLKEGAVLAAAVKTLGAELDLRLDTEILGVEHQGDHVTLRSRAADGQERQDSFEWILAAAGRPPNVKSLALEQSGLELDDKGLPEVDAHTAQCGHSAVFMAGDVIGERPLLHEAVDTGRIAGENAALYPDVLPGLRRAPIGVAFTEPQIATVGKTSHFAEGQKHVVGEASFDDQGRSRVMLQNHGLLQVYAEVGTGLFLGARMVCPSAEHLAHLMAWACQSGMTIRKMLEMPFYHPVVEEGLRTALRDAANKLHKLADIDFCADCTPGM